MNGFFSGKLMFCSLEKIVVQYLSNNLIKIVLTMHKQGEIGSPLCKVLHIEDYTYRGETKTDRDLS